MYFWKGGIGTVGLFQHYYFLSGKDIFLFERASKISSRRQQTQPPPTLTQNCMLRLFVSVFFKLKSNFSYLHFTVFSGKISFFPSITHRQLENNFKFEKRKRTLEFWKWIPRSDALCMAPVKLKVICKCRIEKDLF